MSVWKASVAGVVLSCLVVFILQNREVLELRFLFWDFQTRRAYVLIAVFGAGLLLGWIVATISQLAARGREAAAAHAARHHEASHSEGSSSSGHGSIRSR